MPPSLDNLLANLESAKNHYHADAGREISSVVNQLAARTFTDPKPLLRFHEALLFFRAFPHSATLVAQIEKILDPFHLRVEHLRTIGADMAIFDDFDTSGLSGTVMQDTLSFEAARWLVRRLPNNVAIAWDDYEQDYSAERAWGLTWPRFIPLLEEDADVEANIPWRRWLDTSRGQKSELEFLIASFERAPLPDRQRVELYDSLRIPIRWRLENLKLSRTRNWTRPRKLFVHTEPLIARPQVSLAHELAQTAPRLAKLSPREGAQVIETIREIMLVRYRELYGTTIGDARSVVCAHLDRGVVIYLWNLPPARRLPLRAYVAGFTLKNGVPVNYIEAIGLCEWIEVGFNTFYTYRQGETAWIYAQALRCLHAFTGATTISIYPYQIGQNNDEALDSGAFWFYRKLGFRCGRPDLEQLASREEQRIARDPKYRTPRRTLKRLAEAHVFYEIECATIASIAVEERPFRAASDEQREEPGFSPSAGPWDTFSTRNLGLHISARMADEFAGDAAKLRAASLNRVTRALKLNPSRWTPAQRASLERWSPVLSLIPNLSRWTPKEKRALIALIQSQSAPNEMSYLKLTQRHARLRAELLRLGSTSPASSSK